MNDSPLYNKVTTSMASDLYPNNHQESINHGINPSIVLPFRAAQSKTYPTSTLTNYPSLYNVNHDIGKYQPPKVTFNSYSKPVYQFGQTIYHPQTRYKHQDFLKYSKTYNNSGKLAEIGPHQNWNDYNNGSDRWNHYNNNYPGYHSGQNYSNTLPNNHTRTFSGLQHETNTKSPVTIIGNVEENRAYMQDNFHHNKQIIEPTIQNHNLSKETDHTHPLQKSRYNSTETLTYNKNSKIASSSKSKYSKYNLYSCIDEPFNAFTAKGCEAVTCPSNQIYAKDDYHDKEWM